MGIRDAFGLTGSSTATEGRAPNIHSVRLSPLGRAGLGRLVLILVLLHVPSLPPQVAREDMSDKTLVAHDIVCAQDVHAGIDLDLDRSGSAVLVNHGDAALSGAVLLEGAHDGASNGVGVLGRRVTHAHDVVVAVDSDGGVDA